MKRTLYLLLGALLAALLLAPGVMGATVTVQAESYSSHGGPAEKDYFPSVGSDALCYIKAGEWTQYTVYSPAAGTATLTAYIATVDARTVKIYVNGVYQKTLAVADTNSWTNFVGRTTTITLKAGANTIKFVYSGPMNFDRFTVTTPSAGPLVASFTYQVTPGTYTVKFTDTSTGGPTSWKWSAPWLAGSFSTLQNPTRTFAGPGTHYVKLTVQRGLQTSTVTKAVIVPALGSIAKTYQAESYSSYGGGTADKDYFPSVGSYALCYIKAGEWTQYNNIVKTTAGTYPLKLYIATVDARSVQIYVNGGYQKTIPISDTNSWTTFNARPTTVNLKAGANTIKYIYSGPMNFDRFVV